ncbi:hypothetical protein ACIP1X_29150, partial [Pseudomonas sp. NPDC088885]|uniref:hypothetical protein n=1 Tax=Pseudomonas sp. NPDC088885 TaxID=3364457 RepID=UPI00382E1897
LTGGISTQTEMTARLNPNFRPIAAIRESGESGRKMLIYHGCKLRVLARFLATFQSAMLLAHSGMTE